MLDIWYINSTNDSYLNTYPQKLEENTRKHQGEQKEQQTQQKREHKRFMRAQREGLHHNTIISQIIGYYYINMLGIR